MGESWIKVHFDTGAMRNAADAIQSDSKRHEILQNTITAVSERKFFKGINTYKDTRDATAMHTKINDHRQDWNHTLHKQFTECVIEEEDRLKLKAVVQALTQ